MAQPVADRNLLFGMLAMQMDFITKEQLFAAMQAWVFDKGKSLGDILKGHRAIDEENRALLDALVQKHLAKHGNDAEKSLAALSSANNIRSDLERIADADVQASLRHVSVARPKAADPYATVAPPPSVKTGQTAARFRIVRPHAKGGLGEVFVARDEELNREVALKEIQDFQADDPESRTRFMLEAEITGGLEHPGIVPVYGLGTYADGRPYYAMRFIRGDSLKDAIDRFHKADKAGSLSAGERTLTMRALLGRLVDVCNAIAYAHARGVLHRDLKPGNIMLGKYGETLVVDWGLAKPLDEPMGAKEATEVGEGSLLPSLRSTGSQTIMGAAVGTPQYMSPEQAAGRLELLGPASDVYSLGATLFCLLTGKSPISESDIGTVLQRVQRGEIPKPREIKTDVARPLEAICMKAMALKPEDRYATPRHLADDIEHWLADEPVAAWPEPWTVKARRWIGHNATLVTGAVTAVVIALVSLIVTAVLLKAANDRERLAKEEAITQKNKAEVQEKEAIKQRNLAEENFKLARGAVDRYHTEVSESVILHEPGMQPLRKKLLEAAREFYDRFTKDKAEDKALKGELGKATYRLARITGDIDSKETAIALHQRAADIFEGLPAEKATLDYRADQAACYHHQGVLFRETSEYDKAKERFNKALNEWAGLLKENANDPNYLTGQALSQNSLANVHQERRHLKDADMLYQDALKTRRVLAAANAKDAAAQRNLGTTLSNLGVLHTDLGPDSKADEFLIEARSVQEKLVGDYPHIAQYKSDLAATHYNLSKLHTRESRSAKAASGYEEAATLFKELVDRHPAHTTFQERLAETHGELAEVYTAIARDFGGKVPDDKAAQEAQKALAIRLKLADAHKDVPRYQSDVARSLYALGNAFSALGKRPEAATAFLDAIKVHDKLVGADSKSLNFQRDAARTQNGLGQLFVAMGKEKEALGAFGRALETWEKLTAAREDNEEYAVGLATTHSNLGNVARLAGEFKSARDAYSKALASLETRAIKSSKSVTIQESRRDAHWMRAVTLNHMKLHADSLADWDRAVELTPRKDDRAFFQLPRAEAMVRAGRHVDGVKEADSLVKFADKGSFYLFARLYALAHAAATADDKADPVARKKLTEQYATEALRLLSAAAKAGVFDSPGDREKLQSDPDLRSLQNLPEFKKLVSEAKSK